MNQFAIYTAVVGNYDEICQCFNSFHMPKFPT